MYIGLVRPVPITSCAFIAGNVPGVGHSRLASGGPGGPSGVPGGLSGLPLPTASITWLASMSVVAALLLHPTNTITETSILRDMSGSAYPNLPEGTHESA